MKDFDRFSEHLTIGSALINVARKWRREIDHALLKHGLSQTTALPLIVLHRRGGTVRQGAIAEEIGVEGPSLVRVMDALEADAMVQRVADPTDRRAKMVSLTPQGAAKAIEIEQILSQVRDTITADIEDDDLATTLTVLKQLLAKLTCREEKDSETTPRKGM
ncbi:MarR family winged helix-turn-helix transcriptional regulator [Thalassospira profundimaris]|uniref:MarR family winged helix-turn-helix transcriptional regulator n=1 Tax=Thalassospira profundimaris TaxID=502049 RepID=UPI000DED8944|nr:MarR family transcriptional regulator [Thalassospira profundimaris]